MRLVTFAIVAMALGAVGAACHAREWSLAIPMFGVGASAAVLSRVPRPRRLPVPALARPLFPARATSPFWWYQPLEAIASSDIATTYRGRAIGSAGMDRWVAIDVLRPSHALEAARFLDDVRAAASLDHVNIARIIDGGQYAGATYTIVERIDGESLRSVLERLRATRRRMPVALALEIVHRLCAALAAAHAASVAHRAVSATHVIVSRDGEVKLRGWGAARLRLARAAHDSVAPEEDIGVGVDARADVFRLAALAYELVTGTRADLDLQRSVEPGRSCLYQLNILTTTRFGAPPGLDAILLRALQLVPARRHASCVELGRDLDTVPRGVPRVAQCELAHWLDGELPARGYTALGWARRDQSAPTRAAIWR